MVVGSQGVTNIPQVNNDIWTMTVVVQDSDKTILWRNGQYSQAGVVDASQFNRNKTSSLMINPVRSDGGTHTAKANTWVGKNKHTVLKTRAFIVFF